MARGTIAKIMDRGFGFIKQDEGGDLFFHRNELDGVEFNSLREGQEVEFEKGQGRDGRPAATKVRLAEGNTDDAGSDADSDAGSDADSDAGSDADSDASSDADSDADNGDADSDDEAEDN